MIELTLFDFYERSTRSACAKVSLMEAKDGYQYWGVEISTAPTSHTERELNKKKGGQTICDTMSRYGVKTLLSAGKILESDVCLHIHASPFILSKEIVHIPPATSQMWLGRSFFSAKYGTSSFAWDSIFAMYFVKMLSSKSSWFTVTFCWKRHLNCISTSFSSKKNSFVTASISNMCNSLSYLSRWASTIILFKIIARTLESQVPLSASFCTSF